MFNLTYKEYVEKADILIGLGVETVHLSTYDGSYSSEVLKFVTDVESSCAFRLGIPIDVKLIAKHPCGLTFSWYQEIEDKNANGKGVHFISESSLATLASKLPQAAKIKFSKWLKSEVLPAVNKQKTDIYAYYLSQSKSEMTILEAIEKIDNEISSSN